MDKKEALQLVQEDGLAKKMIASAEEDPEQDLTALLTEYYVRFDKS